MIYKKLLSITLVASLIVIGAGWNNRIQALSTSAQGIQISPALVEVNAEPGSTRLINLNVMNITSSDLVYTESVVDFDSSDETGSPHIITDSDLPETASIKTWLSHTPQFTLAAGKTKTIAVKLTVPANAEAGGHYGVLRFSGAAPELDSNGVGLSASAGVLILVRVDGEIKEEATLSSFYSANDTRQSWFFENSPINFIIRIKNNGNVHVKPSGSIEIRDMFGAVVDNVDINKKDPKANILPDSIRRFEGRISKEWMFGKYTANLTLGYGNKGQAITSTISFWVIPYKIIAAALFVILTAVFIIKRMMKSYNRRVIEKYKNEKNSQTKTKSKKS